MTGTGSSPSWIAPLQLIAMAALGLGLASCDERWKRLDPPRLVQMTCKPMIGEGAMVLVIDTGLGRVTWANANGGPTGSAQVSERDYRVQFPTKSAEAPWAAVVRRFDGVMDREVGKAPFNPGGKPTVAGNARQVWRCVAEKAGPKL